MDNDESPPPEPSELAQSDSPDEPADPDEAAEQLATERRARLTVAIAVMLSLTALLTAFSTLIGADYSRQQSSAYTEATLLAVQGGQAWTAASRTLQQDKEAANQLADVVAKRTAALAAGDQGAAAAYQWQMDNIVWGRGPTPWIAGVGWASAEHERTGSWVSPFMMPGLTDSYYKEANSLLDSSARAQAKGDAAKQASNAFGLVAVGFAGALLLLGAAEVVRRVRPRIVLACVGGTVMLASAVYACVLALAVFANLGVPR